MDTHWKLSKRIKRAWRHMHKQSETTRQTKLSRFSSRFPPSLSEHGPAQKKPPYHKLAISLFLTKEGENSQSAVLYHWETSLNSTKTRKQKKLLGPTRWFVFISLGFLFCLVWSVCLQFFMHFKSNVSNWLRFFVLFFVSVSTIRFVWNLFVWIRLILKPLNEVDLV